MVDAQIITENGHELLATEKKEKSSSKLRRKRSKSEGKRKSSKKESSKDRNEELYTNGDDGAQSSELKIQVEIKGNSSTWNSREFHDQDNPDTWDETGELKGEEDLPPQHVAKVPSRQKSSKKGKKSSKRSGSEKDLSKHLNRPRRTKSDASIDKSDDGTYEENIRTSGRSLKSIRSRGTKEDKKTLGTQKSRR